MSMTIRSGPVLLRPTRQETDAEGEEGKSFPSGRENGIVRGMTRKKVPKGQGPALGVVNGAGPDHRLKSTVLGIA